MIKCKKCGEYNTDAAKRCFKCDATIIHREGEVQPLGVVKDNKALRGLAIIAVTALIVWGAFALITHKSPTQKIIEDLSNIKIGVDEEAYKEMTDALQKFKDSTTP